MDNICADSDYSHLPPNIFAPGNHVVSQSKGDQNATLVRWRTIFFDFKQNFHRNSGVSRTHHGGGGRDRLGGANPIFAKKFQKTPLSRETFGPGRSLFSLSP